MGDYIPIDNTAWLWKHESRRTVFALYVDDFGVKYFSPHDVQHLIDTLITLCSIQWLGKTKILWLNIRLAIPKRLCRYWDAKLFKQSIWEVLRVPPIIHQYASHSWIPKKYWAKTQYAPPKDCSKKLIDKEIQKVQSKVGTFLFYAWPVDQHIQPASNKIACVQASPIE